jgi:hypothetical protein
MLVLVPLSSSSSSSLRRRLKTKNFPQSKHVLSFGLLLLPLLAAFTKTAWTFREEEKEEGGGMGGEGGGGRCSRSVTEEKHTLFFGRFLVSGNKQCVRC